MGLPKSMINWLINFNGISTRLGLFCAKIFEIMFMVQLYTHFCVDIF